MRLLGIDYGTKRVGIALSDEQGSMAFPHTVLKNDAELLAAICEIIKKEGVGEVVIGFSHDKEGKPNAVHTQVEELIGDLTLQLGIPVHLESEIFTTQAALRIQGRNGMTDASAAALILDGFITRKH